MLERQKERSEGLKAGRLNLGLGRKGNPEFDRWIESKNKILRVYRTLKQMGKKSMNKMEKDSGPRWKQECRRLPGSRVRCFQEQERGPGVDSSTGYPSR